MSQSLPPERPEATTSSCLIPCNRTSPAELVESSAGLPKKPTELPDLSRPDWPARLRLVRHGGSRCVTRKKTNSNSKFCLCLFFKKLFKAQRKTYIAIEAGRAGSRPPPFLHFYGASRHEEDEGRQAGRQAGGRQQAASSIQQAAGSRRSRQQATGKVAGSRQQTAGSRQAGR